MAHDFDLGKLLVAAPRHTPLRVRHILFDSVRERCADRGIREGADVRCVGATPKHLLLELPDGRTVTLERSLSTCVEVEAVAARARGGVA